MDERTPRRRLSKQDRHAQLLDVARDLIRDAGTDELTLGRLAERAGVTKPVVYDHFGDRAGLLAELYRAFEARQRATLEVAIEQVAGELPAVAGVVAGAYIDCSIAEGQEMADVVAALAGSSTLSRVRQEAEEAYVDMCRAALEPFGDPLDAAGLHAFVGAADALARHVLAGRIGAARARAVLTHVLIAIATDQTEVTP